jgi:hypothetical protein
VQNQYVDPPFVFQPLQNRARAVSRVVIDADNLLTHGHRAHLVEDLLDRVALIEHRDEHREHETLDRHRSDAAHVASGLGD